MIKYLNINSSTFYDKLKRESFTPNEVEKIAQFFKKSISYYFDKNEEQYQVIDYKKEIIEEAPKPTRVCKECLSKQNEIDALKQALEAKEELLQMYREKKGDCAANSA